MGKVIDMKAPDKDPKPAWPPTGTLIWIGPDGDIEIIYRVLEDSISYES